MKSLAILFVALTLSSFAAETLHVYTWADYVNPDVVEAFEQQHDCKVVIDTFDSNESMYAKLKAGAAGYDLIFPTSYMIQPMEQEGLLLELDHSKLPNLKNIDPEILAKVHDRTMKRSVPYTVGYAVIAYRKDKLKDIAASWATFDRPDIAQRMTLFDDMRETLGAALKFLGHSINTHDDAQLAAARDVVIRWKRNAARFDNEGYKVGLDSGEFLVVHGYSGDLFQVMNENPDVEVVIPKEGVTASCDEMVIPKSAPNPALAHAFINHLLEARVAASNMEWMGYLCPNTPALKRVSPKFLKNPAVTIPDEVKARSEVIQDLGPDLAKYTKVWDEIKAAR